LSTFWSKRNESGTRKDSGRFAVEVDLDDEGVVMPGRKVHEGYGRACGVGFAALAAHGQARPHFAIEMAGGWLGGTLGARLPDILEPATWPGHRQLAHSWTAFGGSGAASIKLLGSWQTYCRGEAERLRRQRLAADTMAHAALGLGILELLFRLASGFGAGLAAGYISHLALDSQTSMGLPLVGRLPKGAEL